MTETFLALYTAHLLADYAFQTKWMVENKSRFSVLLRHASIVFVVTVLTLGGGVLVALGLSAAHLLIDWVKTHDMPDTLSTYLLDQAAHLVTVLLASLFFPTLFADGLWGGFADQMTLPAILLCGVLLSSPAGGPAVGLLLKPLTHDNQIEPGLTRGGRMIGLLERGLIFLMVLSNQLAGIGFLIAAKSILRFDTASKDQKNSEYVIIGTLASFSWALIVALGTEALITL